MLYSSRVHYSFSGGGAESSVRRKSINNNCPDLHCGINCHSHCSMVLSRNMWSTKASRKKLNIYQNSMERMEQMKILFLGFPCKLLRNGNVQMWKKAELLSVMIWFQWRKLNFSHSRNEMWLKASACASFIIRFLFT